MKNPYVFMDMPQLLRMKKELVATLRIAKTHQDRPHMASLRNKIGMVRQCMDKVAKERERHPVVEVVDPIKEKIQEIKLADRQERISKFGFAISSHALRRYKLRFDPNMHQEQLYELMAKTDIAEYVKMKDRGQIALSDECVAVIKDKLILTFKNPTVDQ